MAYDLKKTQELWSLLNNLSIYEKWSDAVVEKIKSLIMQGADFTVKESNYGNTIAHMAILAKSPDLAKFVLQQDKDKLILNEQDDIPEARNTPLMLAVKSGFYDLAIALLKLGANSNIASGEDNMTALHYAMGLLGAEYQLTTHPLYQRDNQNNEKLIQLIYELIKHGANIKAENIFGSTPIDILNNQFSLDKDDAVFEERLPEISFADFFNLDAKTWAQYEEHYRYELINLENQYSFAIFSNDKAAADSAQAAINELLSTASVDVKSVYQLHKQYLEYKKIYFDLDLYNPDALEEHEKEYQSINPKFSEFLKISSTTPKRYSCQELLALAKTGNNKFSHLNSIEAIHTEAAQPSGIIQKQSTGQDYGHSYKENDYHSIIAGVSWHRDDFSNVSLIKNRNQFFISSQGKETIEKIYQLCPQYSSKPTT